MSLDYNLKGVANRKEICFDDTGSLRPVTESLIFATMVVGLGKITTENAPKFFRRLRIYERLNGGFITGPGNPHDWLIKPEDVLAHVGLSTNVATETDAAWRKRTMDNAERDVARIFTNELRRQERETDAVIV